MSWLKGSMEPEDMQRITERLDKTHDIAIGVEKGLEYHVRSCDLKQDRLLEMNNDQNKKIDAVHKRMDGSDTRMDRIEKALAELASRTASGFQENTRIMIRVALVVVVGVLALLLKGDGKTQVLEFIKDVMKLVL